MSPASSDPEAHFSARGARQKRIITSLAGLLIIGGLAVLFFLARLPLPLRILVGLTDVFAGLTILVLVRQKFAKK